MLTSVAYIYISNTMSQKYRCCCR